jgi:hypothetical protein
MLSGRCRSDGQEPHDTADDEDETNLAHGSAPFNLYVVDSPVASAISLAGLEGHHS